MRILCACEESQAVTIELRHLGHDAYSNDIMPCRGGHPEWHIRADARDVVKDSWDICIAFPPCQRGMRTHGNFLPKTEHAFAPRLFLELLEQWLNNGRRPPHPLGGDPTMIAYPDKALVTTWHKSEGVWRKVKTTHVLEPGGRLVIDLGSMNDERTHVKSIEFLYGTERKDV